MDGITIASYITVGLWFIAGVCFIYTTLKWGKRFAELHDELTKGD